MPVVAVVIIAEPMLIAFGVTSVVLLAIVAIAGALLALVVATAAAVAAVATAAAVAAVSAAVVIATAGLVASTAMGSLLAPDVLLMGSAIVAAYCVPPRHSVARAHAQALLPCARVVA